MKKVLVVGATGYLGKHVITELKSQGYWIRVLARNPKKLEEVGQFLEPAVTDKVDDIFTAEVTKPESLEGLCKDIDFVISSLGITRQKGKLSFMDVDYQGNMNVLIQALKSLVKKFIFVSVYKADQIENLAEAREKFVQELRNSGIDYSIIRPNGFFSDMSETLKMAMSGKVYLLGEGTNKINPIHGTDLAKVCVDAIEKPDKKIETGGPEVFTYKEIAELAFSVVGKKPKIKKIPIGLINFFAKIIRIFSNHYYTIISFFTKVMTNDLVATKSGNLTLKNYFEEFYKKKLI